MASEVLSSEIPEVTKVLLDNASTLLGPFWDSILSANSYGRTWPVPLHEHPLTKGSYTAKKDEDGSTDDVPMEAPEQQDHVISGRTDGPGFAVLAGYWAKVNMTLLERHPQEMLAFVKTIPYLVEGLTSHFETPAIVELLYRIIQCEDTVPDSGIVAWLAEQGLIPRVVSLLSPMVSSELHKAASEFLKTIISLSAPSPSSLNQVTVQDSFGGPGEMLLGAGGVNNLLVRELASEDMVNRIVSFMLDFGPNSRRSSATQETSRKNDLILHKLQEDSAVEEEEEEEDVWQFRQTMKDRQNRHFSIGRRLSSAGTGVRDSTATIRPSHVHRQSSIRRPISSQCLSSSFVNCAGVFIELIRKNNSDYFEQHLFHTLRNYLVIRQQELSGQQNQERLSQRTTDPSVDEKPELTLENLPLEDDADTEGLDEALDEVAQKMGIVHLGPLLRALAEKIPELQERVRCGLDSSGLITTSMGQIEPLTHTRYCIVELYAELLHCSNMALLNRPANSGPTYSPSGSLLGGLEGLHALARTLQGEDDLEQDQSSMSASAEWEADRDENERHLSESSASSFKENGGSSSAEITDSSGSDHAEDGSDAESIASALSSMSLADMISQFTRRRPPAQESDVQIVGNYLKTQFLSFQVIPTLLELLLAFPWNNFLHNVAYDILQQLFNGDMDVAINRKLTISAFKDAHLIETILEGARRNRASSEGPRRIRLGYMGHLNLIAEEIVKLMERYPLEIGNYVQDHFTTEWEKFLNEDLSDYRAKESAPLAGGRPSGNHSGMQNWSNLDSDNWYSSNDNNVSFGHYLSSQMRSGAGDEESEGNAVTFLGQTDSMLDPATQDAVEWGPFADSHSAFEFTSTASIDPQQPGRQENLTPADWAAEFRRGTMDDIPAESAVDNDSDSDDMGDAPDASGSGTDSDDNNDDDSPFVDLHKPGALRKCTQNMDAAHPERVAGHGDLTSDQHWPAAHAAHHVRTFSGGGRDNAAALAAEQLHEAVEPTEEGLLRRTLSDGTTVTAPLDDAELAQS